MAAPAGRGRGRGLTLPAWMTQSGPPKSAANVGAAGLNGTQDHPVKSIRSVDRLDAGEKRGQENSPPASAAGSAANESAGGRMPNSGLLKEPDQGAKARIAAVPSVTTQTSQGMLNGPNQKLQSGSGLLATPASTGVRNGAPSAAQSSNGSTSATPLAAHTQQQQRPGGPPSFSQGVGGQVSAQMPPGQGYSHYTSATGPLGAPSRMQQPYGVMQPSGPPSQQYYQHPQQTLAQPGYPGGYGQPAAMPGMQAANTGAFVAGGGQQVAGLPNMSEWLTYYDTAGRPYYYSTRTGVTTYEIPAATQPNEVPVAAKTGAMDAAASACVWTEYTDPSGRTYYYNTSTRQSVWDEPEELRIYKARQAVAKMKSGQDIKKAGSTGQQEEKSADKTEGAGNAPGEPVVPDAGQDITSEGIACKTGALEQSVLEQARTAMPAEAKVNVRPAEEKNISKKQAKEYATKDEAIAAFKDLLESKNISSSVKWKEVMPQIINEERWTALKTLGEKKQAFAEYQTKRLKEETKIKRQNAKKARDEFMVMLASNREITSRTRWRDAIDLLGEDPRFTAVEDAFEREDLFSEFVSELARTEREDRRRERKEALDAFKGLLLSLGDKITVNTRFPDIESEIENEESYKRLDKVDRQYCFSDIIKELEKEEEERQRLERERKRKEVEEKQEKFKAIVLAAVSEGKVSVGTRWKHFKPTIDEEESYLALVDHGEAARDVFEAVVDELRASFKKSRRELIDLISAAKIKIKAETTLKKFEQMLLSADEEAVAGKDEKEEIDEERPRSPDNRKRRRSSDAQADEGTDEAEHENKEADDSKSSVRTIIEEHPEHVKLVFEDLHEDALRKKKEEDRRRAKQENAFIDLLMEYYYRSDHVGIPWDEARQELKHRSAFRALEEAEARRIFDEYMDDLLAKKEARTKRMKELEEEEERAEQLALEGKTTKDASKGGHRSSSRSRSRSIDTDRRDRSRSARNSSDRESLSRSSSRSRSRSRSKSPKKSKKKRSRREKKKKSRKHRSRKDKKHKKRRKSYSDEEMAEDDRDSGYESGEISSDGEYRKKKARRTS